MILSGGRGLGFAQGRVASGPLPPLSSTWCAVGGREAARKAPAATGRPPDPPESGTVWGTGSLAESTVRRPVSRPRRQTGIQLPPEAVTRSRRRARRRRATAVDIGGNRRRPRPPAQGRRQRPHGPRCAPCPRPHHGRGASGGGRTEHHQGHGAARRRRAWATSRYGVPAPRGCATAARPAATGRRGVVGHGSELISYLRRVASGHQASVHGAWGGPRYATPAVLHHLPPVRSAPPRSPDQRGQPAIATGQCSGESSCDSGCCSRRFCRRRCWPGR